MIRALAALALLAGCVLGAPPGFSHGDTWTLPLVDPLAGGTLVVPVYLHGKGPFLFAIDPDARSLIDVEAEATAGIIPGSDLYDLRVGDLTITSVPCFEVSAHALDAGGRRIFGTLGHDVIADSLVFGFDRERGIAWLSTERAFHPRDGARTIRTYDKLGQPQRRVPLVTTNIDGIDRDLRVDLGRAANRMRRDLWSRAQLAEVADPVTVIDDIGRSHHADRVGVAKRVSAQGIEQVLVRFAPFEDDRYLPSDLDGTLGLDFFAPFALAADWSRHAIYVWPRGNVEATRAMRLARWGHALACTRPGCVQLGVEASILTVTPEAPAHAVEAVVEARTPTGDPLPDLEINLPPQTAPFAVQLPDAYRGAKLEVIDASPFPRTCVAPGGCVVPMTADRR